jgi:hypothetical protein
MAFGGCCKLPKRGQNHRRTLLAVVRVGFSTQAWAGVGRLQSRQKQRGRGSCASCVVRRSSELPKTSGNALRSAPAGCQCTADACLRILPRMLLAWAWRSSPSHRLGFASWQALGLFVPLVLAATPGATGGQCPGLGVQANEFATGPPPRAPTRSWSRKAGWHLGAPPQSQAPSPHAQCCSLPCGQSQLRGGQGRMSPCRSLTTPAGWRERA